MDRAYDLFEKFSNGQMLWKGSAVGHDNAINKLKELAAETENECCVMYLPEKIVIAAINTANPESSPV